MKLIFSLYLPIKCLRVSLEYLVQKDVIMY